MSFACQKNKTSRTFLTYIALCELIKHAHILQDFKLTIKVCEEKPSMIHWNLGRMRVVRFLNQTNSCFSFIKAKWHHSVPHFTHWPSRYVPNFEQAQYDWDVCITLQYVCFHVCSGDGNIKHGFFRRKSEHRVSVPLGFHQVCGLLLVMLIGEVADQVPSYAPWQGWDFL